ncbi:3-demethylubiquinone-9 3-methyltransferase [Nitrospirillum pindoramense]|uniref:Ubiquinone biosynthesis O-methyltransferase n=2 Tax=Nitrospirillum amazonense TaxID=28077 RepID=A0A560H6L1_9PROT|nr:bifunctional 2-polyprenyl-6-hydroxyphenol methylase/3-demethylubiquinol 3-O-methyltransferase UbiG [Nitrospirillum amazonense]TWB41791.1 3-demethylubiquinone-9 3-methyltransferase [Nitrospirillum amazonense]
MSQTATTVDPGEIQRFSAIAAEWWDEAGKFRPLHKLNPVRLEYLRDRICAHFGRDPLAPQPLKGLRLVDIGCGGGLLSEPLARMGAEVVGIDAAERNVKTAATHAMETGTPVDYRHTTAEDLVAAGETFDAVLSLEVVEHVADVPLFLDSLAALLKPEGLLVMATLNRTPKSYLMAIIGAEYVLRWLPRGTHDWRKFLKPSELAAGLRATGLTVREVMGLVYSPFNDAFRLDARDLDVNYLLWASR